MNRKLLFVAIVVLLMTAACTAAPTGAPVETAPAADTGSVGGEKVFRMASFEPDSLDPAIGGPGYQEYQNLYEPLVDAYAPDGEIKPLAAESYAVSDDGLTYTFTLRPDLKWSDGEPVTAENFRFAWLRQLNPETAAYSPNDFYVIKNALEYNQGTITDPNEVGIQAPDEQTLVVTLAEPAPFFLRQVGSNSYFPLRQDILEEYGDQWTEAGNFVGNGPYMLEEWQHDQRLVLVQNPHYNGPWVDSRNIDRIEFTVLQDPWSQAILPYEADEIDVAIVPPTEMDRVSGNSTLSEQVQRLPISGAVILVLDTKNPPTDDVRVRQALAQAIDYDVLANSVLKGAFAPADSFSPPDLASHNPDSFPGTNVEAAQQLLADAGYPNGEGFPTFDLYYWTLERESLLAQAIKAMWQQNLGIDVTLQPLEVQAMRDYRVSRETEPYNAYLALNWSGIPDPREFHNAQLDPDGNVRHSRYDNPTYVDLIRSALTETDPVQRQELYQQAEALVNQEAPIVSIIYEGRTWLVKPYVQNFGEVTTSVAEMTRVASPPGLNIEQ